MRTIFNANPDGGVVAIAMTPDAKYLATLSCGETQVSTHILPKLSYFLQKNSEKVCESSLQKYTHFICADAIHLGLDG